MSDRRIIETVDEVVAVYPQLENYIDAVYCAGLSGKFRGLADRSRHRIIIDMSKMSDWKWIFIRHIIVHECMHMLNYWLEDQGGRIIFDLPDYDVERNISSYALTSPHELFAEVMAYDFCGSKINSSISYLSNKIKEALSCVSG